jgi:hypothetical protein
VVKRMLLSLVIPMSMMLFVSTAQAAVVTYVLQTPGVT